MTKQLEDEKAKLIERKRQEQEERQRKQLELEKILEDNRRLVGAYARLLHHQLHHDMSGTALHSQSWLCFCFRWTMHRRKLLLIKSKEKQPGQTMCNMPGTFLNGCCWRCKGILNIIGILLATHAVFVFGGSCVAADMPKLCRQAAGPDRW